MAMLKGGADYASCALGYCIMYGDPVMDRDVPCCWLHCTQSYLDYFLGFTWVYIKAVYEILKVQGQSQ